MLFSVVRGSGNVQRSIDVPATFVLPPTSTGNPVLLSSLPDKVRVTVRGSPSVLGPLRADDIGPLQIDVREGRARQVHLDAELLALPAGATLVSFTPDTIPMQWDTMVERSVPVRATVVGSLPPRARVERVEVEPSHVHVRGASLYVDPMVSVHTEPVDASGLATRGATSGASRSSRLARAWSSTAPTGCASPSRSWRRCTSAARTPRRHGHRERPRAAAAARRRRGGAR